MKNEPDKPTYYDGSGVLKPFTVDHEPIVIKPDTEARFDGIPYFPYLHENCK